MCVCTRVHMYMHALVVCVGHVSLCVLHVLHSFSVCVHVLCWVNMSPPTHQLSVLTSCRLVHELHVCLWQWSTLSLVPKWSEAELSLPHRRVEFTVGH